MNVTHDQKPGLSSMLGIMALMPFLGGALAMFIHILGQGHHVIPMWVVWCSGIFYALGGIHTVYVVNVKKDHPQLSSFLKIQGILVFGGLFMAPFVLGLEQFMYASAEMMHGDHGKEIVEGTRQLVGISPAILSFGTIVFPFLQNDVDSAEAS